MVCRNPEGREATNPCNAKVWTLWKRILFYQHQTDDDKDDAPIWTEDDFKTAVHRVGLKPVQKNESKTNVEIDSDIAVWFKAQTSEVEFQRLINQTLREAIEGHQLEEVLRKVISEDLQHE